MKNLLLLMGAYYLGSILLIYFLWDFFLFDYLKDSNQAPGIYLKSFLGLVSELPKLIPLVICCWIFFRLNADLKDWFIFVFLLLLFDSYLAYLAGPVRIDNFINKAAFFLEILFVSGYLYWRQKKRGKKDSA